jgi:hypothetical protein
MLQCPHKTMFGSSLPPIVLSYCVFCLCLRVVMSNIVSYHMSLCSVYRVVISSTISAHCGVQHILTIWVTWRVLYKRQELLALCGSLGSLLIILFCCCVFCFVCPQALDVVSIIMLLYILDTIFCPLLMLYSYWHNV